MKRTTSRGRTRALLLLFVHVWMQSWSRPAPAAATLHIKDRSFGFVDEGSVRRRLGATRWRTLVRPVGAPEYRTYDARRSHYIDQSLARSGGRDPILRAYRGLPVDESDLAQQFATVRDPAQTSDFTVIRLLRLLYLQPHLEDAILDALKDYNFWFTEGQPQKVYWSENHMICFMSSQWLLQDRHGWFPGDVSIRRRLEHFLRLKIEYGFYEVFSGTYLPFTLSALLNLVDFALDPSIRALATEAAQRLLREILMVTNDRGVIFAAAGRDYASHRVQPCGHQVNRVIYLLTGLGCDKDISVSTAGVFLATSSLPVHNVYDFWRVPLDRHHEVGHPLEQADTINAALSMDEQVAFQWSQGAYFHPDTALDTVWMLDTYDLWSHEHFADFADYRDAPPWLVSQVARWLGPITRGSVLSHMTVAIHKRGPAVLTSLQGYNAGQQGAQQVPWVATTGTLAVWTQAGEGGEISGLGESLANDSLPMVRQQGNVALVTYNPQALLSMMHDTRVWLHWPQGFDEEQHLDTWRYGRERDAYVAVRAPCDQIDAYGRPSCPAPNQAWVVVVGYAERHGGFQQFIHMTREARIEERSDRTGPWYAPEIEYDVQLEVDGVSLHVSW